MFNSFSNILSLQKISKEKSKITWWFHFSARFNTFLTAWWMIKTWIDRSELEFQCRVGSLWRKNIKKQWQFWSFLKSLTLFVLFCPLVSNQTLKGLKKLLKTGETLFSKHRRKMFFVGIRQAGKWILIFFSQSLG